MIFVDTSAVLAVINTKDEQHATAVREWKRLLSEREKPVTTSYTLAEMIVLTQRRFGMDTLGRLNTELLPLLEVIWVDADIHRAALGAVFAAGRRNLSLVDCASFEVMRRKGLRTAFTLDRDFREQGFNAVP